jgi:hypothetical protein
MMILNQKLLLQAAISLYVRLGCWLATLVVLNSVASHFFFFFFFFFY